jgi:pyruvate formate lyase activating enzyme
MGDGLLMREAILYKKADDRLRCMTCERRCLIKEGDLGFCKTRTNIEGRLYTLIYGSISALSANPIEKKPFFHFHPGTKALTVGSFSCNFTCDWCQNFEISKSTPQEVKFLSPEAFIELVDYYRCRGTSISFNEPTLLLEYALDVFDLAKRKGYYNTFVTNGYMTEGALNLLIAHGLDGMNIDIKGENDVVKRYCHADLEKIWRNAREAKHKGIHVEITTLVIPGVNQRVGCISEIARRIVRDLGEDTPWHLTRYFPAYRFTAPPTQVEMLERARAIGIEAGLKFVYIGNVPGHIYENTYCPRCGKLLIERKGFDICTYRLIDKLCPVCGERIPITGEPDLGFRK